MLEIIKAEFEKKKALNKHNFYNWVQSPLSSQIVGDMYPVMNEYYHELNPGFLHRLTKNEYLNFIQAMTVRDGSAWVGSFLLKNIQNFPKLDTHFIVDKDLAPLIPSHLKQFFSCWSICQHKKTPPSSAKRVLLAGLVSQETFPSLEVLMGRLEVLKEMPEECEIDLFLPVRKNPLNGVWRESYVHYEFLQELKLMFPAKKINFLTTREMMGRSVWNDIWFIDLLSDKLVVADNFLAHYIANRGGTVLSFDSTEDREAYFEIDLSFNHKIQFLPLPKVESIFAELVFYKKSAGMREYSMDPIFHQLLKEL